MKRHKRKDLSPNAGHKKNCGCQVCIDIRAKQEREQTDFIAIPVKPVKGYI